MSKKVRVGLIGADETTKLQLIPGLRAIDDVEIVAVAAPTPDSPDALAQEFSIPKTHETWQALCSDPEVDAVVIGTRPDVFKEVACTALRSGKHVLCGSGMARNLEEAREMRAVARERPELTAMVVPSPFGISCGKAVEHLVKAHFLGDLREVVVLCANDQYWDYSKSMDWRQDVQFVGTNILKLGAIQETLLRWVPQAVQVFAQKELFEPTRPLPEESRFADVTASDSVQILAELQGGARAIYHFSGVILFGPGIQIHLYGSRGTIKVHFVNGEEQVWIGRAEDKELTRLQIPEEELGHWTVEADFISAIRSEKKPKINDFDSAIRTIEFLEAVARSAASNSPVEFPID
jgi:Predicted dehydrogenases and related proteins